MVIIRYEEYSNSDSNFFGNKDKVEKISKIYPFVVFFVWVEIVYNIFIIFLILAEYTNHGKLARIIENQVGVGIIYLLILFFVALMVGIALLPYIFKFLVKTVKLSGRLASLYEDARKRVVFNNIIYLLFFVTVFLLYIYCETGRSPKSFRMEHIYNLKSLYCHKFKIRETLIVIDIFSFGYLGYSVYFLSKIKSIFIKEDNEK